MLENLNVSKDIAMQSMRQFQRPSNLMNNSSLMNINNQYRVEDGGMETSNSSYQNMFSSDEMSTGELQDMGELMEYQNLDMAYEKYLDLMKQSVCIIYSCHFLIS